MNDDYITVGNVLGNGLVTVNVRGIGNQIWVRTRKRSLSMTFKICGRNLQGEFSYRPTGSPSNRSDRVCIEHIEK